MANLVPKIFITIVLIGIATLVGRRWGPGVGGWLVGLPLTSGPVALFLALDHGSPFAASAAGGSLVGAAAEAAFCLGYLAAARHGAVASFLAGTAAFVAASAVLLPAPALGPPLEALLVVVVLLLVLRLLPGDAGERPEVVPPAWDLPARAVVGASIVVAITALAPVLGPQLSGIAAAYPVFASVLTVFAHLGQGRPAMLAVLRGLVVGLFAFTAFFVVLGMSIVELGVAAAFALAIGAALVVQAVTLRAVRRQPLASTGAADGPSVGQASGAVGVRGTGAQRQ